MTDLPECARPDRRRFLGGVGAAAAGVGAAWVAPDVVTVPAASAATQPQGLAVTVGSFLGSPLDWTSTTLGATWSAPVTLPGGTAAYGVAYDGVGLWVAVGDAIWTSPDGATWTAASTIPASFDGRSVATDGAGHWVSVGISGFPVHRSSAPGTSWQVPSSAPSTVSLSGVATDGLGTWVAVGSSGAWFSSDDGDTWGQIDTSLTYYWNAAAVATDGNGNWVAVGPTPGLGAWRWTTGAPAWSDATTTITSRATSVATDGNGLWVIVGDDGTGAPGSAGQAWTSTDNGATWTAAAQPPTDPVNGVAASGTGEWVTVGNGFSAGGSWISADGSTWTQSSTPIGNGVGVTPAYARLLP